MPSPSRATSHKKRKSGASARLSTTSASKSTRSAKSAAPSVTGSAFEEGFPRGSFALLLIGVISVSFFACAILFLAFPYEYAVRAAATIVAATFAVLTALVLVESRQEKASRSA